MKPNSDAPLADPPPSGQRPIHQGVVISCAFLGGPGALATGSMEGAIAIWDVEAGVALRRIPAHAGPIPALAWDARRGRLISGGHDWRILALDPVTGAATGCFKGCEGGLFTLAVSPDGEVLASGGYDRVIRLWRLADGALLGALPGHEGAVTDLDFLDDGRLASCGRDCQVIVWDLARRAELVRTAGHARWPMGVRASADGRRLFSGGEDDQVRAWAADTGALIWRQRFSSPVWGLERTTDGGALIVGAGAGVKRLDLGPDGASKPVEIAVGTARAMARCEGLIALGADAILLYRPDAPDEPPRRLDTGAPLCGAVAAIRRPAAPDGGPPGIVAVIARYHGQVDFDIAGARRPLEPAHAGIAFAACVVGEALFATVGFDGKIHLRRAADGALVRSMDHGGHIFTVSASSDGARLLTVGADRVRLWDVATGESPWAGENLGLGFHSWGSLSADGSCALAVGEGQGLHRWSFAGGEAKRDLVMLDIDPRIGTCGLMGVVAIDAGTAAVCSAAGEVRRADLATGRTEPLHAAHESGVRGIGLSPDRRWLLSFSENSVTAVYDLVAGRLRTPAAIAGAAVPAATFTPDGDLVWVDGAGALHGLSPEALDALAKS